MHKVRSDGFERAVPKPINRSIEPFPAPDADTVARATGGAPIELGGLACL